MSGPGTRAISQVSKPRLQSRLLLEAEQQWKEVLTQLDDNLGMARTLQDHQGGQVNVQLNTKTLQLEIYVDGRWKPLSQTPAAATSSKSSFDAEGSSGRLIASDLAIGGDLLMQPGKRVDGLDLSELLDQAVKVGSSPEFAGIKAGRIGVNCDIPTDQILKVQGEQGIGYALMVENVSDSGTGYCAGGSIRARRTGSAANTDMQLTGVNMIVAQDSSPTYAAGGSITLQGVNLSMQDQGTVTLDAGTMYQQKQGLWADCFSNGTYAGNGGIFNTVTRGAYVRNLFQGGLNRTGGTIVWDHMGMRLDTIWNDGNGLVSHTGSSGKITGIHNYVECFIHYDWSFNETGFRPDIFGVRSEIVFADIIGNTDYNIYGFYAEYGGDAIPNLYSYYAKAGSGDWCAHQDDMRFFFGAGMDASISYDGTNMIINPKEVGAGVLSVLGIVKTQGYQSSDGSAGITATVSLAKITAGGVDGSLTVKNGIITGVVNPT